MLLRTKQLVVDSNLDMLTFLIRNLGTPTLPGDAVNLQYVTDLIEGFAWKQPVVAATVGPIVLNGPQVIDTQPVVAGNRVLVKDQGDPRDNGIYNCAAGPWTRAADASTGAELRAAACVVLQGSVNLNQGFVQTTPNPVIGVDNIVFVRFTGLGMVTAGAGLDQLGNTIWVGAGQGIQVNANDVQVLPDPGHASIAIGAPGVKAAVPYTGNKDMAASATLVDFDLACATAIAVTPSGDAYVTVFVNGVQVAIGDGVRTRECYFSADGGATAKTIANIQAGDRLYWVGSVAGYQLQATDRVDFCFNYIV